MSTKYNHEILEQALKFFYKILIPSIIAISIKLAIEMKEEKVSLLRVVMSFVIGIGGAYFVFAFTEDNVQQKYVPLIVGAVSISSEKIAKFLIYKLNIDLLLKSIIEALKDALIKFISK